MGVWWSRAAMVTPTVVADSQGTLGMSLGWWVLLVWAQATPTCRYRAVSGWYFTRVLFQFKEIVHMGTQARWGSAGHGSWAGIIF